MGLRFRYNSVLAGCLLFAAFILSILSTIDCVFVTVDVGFIPETKIDVEDKSATYGIGLWSVEDSAHKGLCVMPIMLKEKEYSLNTNDDDLYTQFMTSSDTIFTVARIIALVGCFFGLLDVSCAWAAVFLIIDQKRRRFTVNLSLLAFICEGLKIALVFMSSPCTSDDFWERLEEDEVITFHSADQCWLSRGAFMSVASAVVYFLVVIYCFIAIVFKDYSHKEQRSMRFEEISVPSYMQSVGSNKSNMGSSGAQSGNTG